MQLSEREARFGPGEEPWEAAICSGAPPFERLRHPAFRADGEAGDVETARRWVDGIARGFSGRREELLAGLGLDDVSVVRAFGRARFAPGQALPAWAECLVQTVRCLPRHSPETTRGEDSMDVASGVFLDAARSLLRWDVLRARHEFLDSRLLLSLTRQLGTRVLLACGATLELENTTRAEPIWDLGRDAWLERLCGFTGLNFVVGTAIRQWRQNTLEIVARLARDLPWLRQELLGGAPGPLVAVEGDLGDRHSDGRAVAVLVFASGVRVVYKPKDLRCSEKFLSLIGFLNSGGPSLELPTRRILCREDHAWEEFVEQRTATTDAEVARFFQRYGMLLRILQVVEGRDFWIDNLRADGDSPVFIDLECILHPRIVGAGFRVPVDLEPELYEESVLPTAATSQAIEVPGFGKQDFGGLSAGGARLLPFGMWSGYRDRRNGNIWLKSGRLYWRPDVAWPQPAEGPAEPSRYVDELERGYREMQALLRRHASGLLAAGGPLEGVGTVPVRALMRSTWEYLVLLRASLEPSSLLDGNSRELALAHVVSTAPPWGLDDAKRLAIARSELDSLRILDIPEFHSLPSSTSLWDTWGAVVTDVFGDCAHGRLQERLRSVDSFNTDRHLHILRVAVGSIVRNGA